MSAPNLTGAPTRAHKGARNNADRTALHQGRPVSLRGHRVPPDHERDPQSGRLGRVPRRQRRGPGVLVAGRLRRSRAEVFPQGRRAGAAEEGRGRDRPVLPVALGRRRGGARRAAREASASSASTPSKQVFDRLAGTWTYWGWKGGYFDTRSRRAGLLRRAALHAGDADGARRTRRNGSTPACTGPTASTARARATTTSTSRPAS